MQWNSVCSKVIHLVARKIWPLKKVGFFDFLIKNVSLVSNITVVRTVQLWNFYWLWPLLLLSFSENLIKMLSLLCVSSWSSDKTLENIQIEFFCTAKCFKVALKYVLIVVLDLLLKRIRFFKMNSLLSIDRQWYNCTSEVTEFSATWI